jgi:diguanylate cyclase (GGDEF)-like protein/PAS domain S-box-containing protein
MPISFPPADAVSGEILEQALDNCARERIHVPGSIQPGGVLVAVSPEDGLIRMASTNLNTLFPAQAAVCLGQPLANLVGMAQAEILLRPDIGDWRSAAIQSLSIDIEGRQETHDALVYHSDALLVIEIERLASNDSNLFQNLFIPLRDALWRLDAEHSMQRYCQAVVDQVRLLTGYDHVMMYRFEANWDGIVIAESRTEDSPAYLGNRFPASDIPPQARALYTKNLVRLLEDRDAMQVPILPSLNPLDNHPLDLTHSALRSMSPVHLEYLRNMDVRATLTISLLQNQRLWGLIASHHNTPKYVSLRERELDAFVGKTVSLKLTTLDGDERTEFNNRVRNLLDKISSEIRQSGRIDEVIEHNQTELLGLVRAQGAVVNIGGRRHTVGSTPAEAELDALLLRLRALPDSKVFSTDNLAALHPAAATYQDVASGVLIASLDASMLSFIIWFRPSILRTLNWAGQPDKIVMRDGEMPRISPRTSFDSWVQTYRDKSAPWSQVEVDAANMLALAIIEVLSQRALASSEESYRLLAEHSTDLIAQLDPQGLCNFVSPACLDILGIPPRSMIGLPLSQFTLPEDRVLLDEALANLGKQDATSLLLRFRHPEGALVWIEASFKRIAYLNAPDQIILNARDVTQRHLYQLAIEDLHRRNSRIMDATGEGLVSLQQDGTIIYVNEQAGRMFGCDPQSMQGKYCCQVLAWVGENGQIGSDECKFLDTIRQNKTHQATAKNFRHHDGHPILLDYVSTPVIEDGQPQGCVIVFRESLITPSPAGPESTTEAILNATTEAVMVTNTKGQITSVNRAFYEITGYSEAEAIGQTPRLFKSGIHTQDFYKKLWHDLEQDHRWNGEIWNRRKNGEIYPQWGSITALTDPSGQVRNYVAVFSDISKAKQAEEKLYYLANHDSLTGLPNRMLFGEQLASALDRSKRFGQKLAVMFIDLDRFKIINDTLGHAVGDAFLCAIAKRLGGATRKGEILARLGGDEFVLAVHSPEDQASLDAMAQRLLTNLSLPIDINGHELTPTASIGISLYPADGLLANDLIRAADTAMYRAKELGRNGIQFYSQQMADVMNNKFKLSTDLRRALRNSEFLLYYQPQVDCSSGKMVGLEALMRWQHPLHGIVSPGEFIPVATELGMISDLGDWVLEAACTQMRAWLDAGIDIPRVAVNVAPVQFNKAFVEQVARVLVRFNLSPNRLEIEITEGALERSAEVREVMMGLRGLGVELSVDDFGTGYSSLAHVKTFPVSCFKIDKSFVDNVPGNRQDEAIIRTIMALGNSLNIDVLAEGVETRAQFDFLKATGVDFIQGFYFDRPLPANQIDHLLDYPLARA